jgi:hypothetical protein
MRFSENVSKTRSHRLEAWLKWYSTCLASMKLSLRPSTVRKGKKKTQSHGAEFSTIYRNCCLKENRCCYGTQRLTISAGMWSHHSTCLSSPCACMSGFSAQQPAGVFLYSWWKLFKPWLSSLLFLTPRNTEQLSYLTFSVCSIVIKLFHSHFLSSSVFPHNQMNLPYFFTILLESFRIG